MCLEDFFSTYDLGVSYYACLCYYACVCAATVFDILCMDVKVIKMVTMRTPIQGKAWLTTQGMSTRLCHRVSMSTRVYVNACIALVCMRLICV